MREKHWSRAPFSDRKWRRKAKRAYCKLATRIRPVLFLYRNFVLFFLDICCKNSYGSQLVFVEASLEILLRLIPIPWRGRPPLTGGIAHACPLKIEEMVPSMLQTAVTCKKQ